MDQKALFLKHWDKEGQTTRKVLARIPEGSDYRPDPKSMTAREKAWVIARETLLLGEGLHTGVLNWADAPVPATMQEILASFDRDLVRASELMRALDVSGWERKVPFMYGDQQIGGDTGFGHAWGFLFDIIHHRGQITTYLRPMGSTVPQVYGPSADEP